MLVRAKSSQHLTRKPEPFPLHNRKLRLENWQERCITIKQYRSRSQLARKRSEPIPLLINNHYASKLNPAQITRSQQREYNVYLRRSEGGSDFTYNKQVVNGQTRKLREVAEEKSNPIPFCLTAPNWHSTRLRQSQHLLDQKLVLTNEHFTGNTLQVMGEEVKLSQERGQRRSISNFDYRELKW